MATKLDIYNRALLHLGEGRLETLTDDVEARYVLEAAFPTVALDALSRGDFNFAIKRVEVEQSSTTEAIPGYEFAYDHPTDWLRTIAYSALADFRDIFFNESDLDLVDQMGAWHTNLSQLYVEYISTDAVADSFIPNYPPSYVEFVAALLARQICERLTQGTTKIQYLDQVVIKQTLLKAKSNDARNLKQGTLRPGVWSRALRGGGVQRTSSIGTIVGGQISTRQEDL